MEPFPTIYWVTHPRVRSLISKLELEKWGIKVEQCLKDDADATKSMQLAHNQYGQERHSMITTKDWAWIQQ